MTTRYLYLGPLAHPRPTGTASRHGKLRIIVVSEDGRAHAEVVSSQSHHLFNQRTLRGDGTVFVTKYVNIDVFPCDIHQPTSELYVTLAHHTPWQAIYMPHFLYR